MCGPQFGLSTQNQGWSWHLDLLEVHFFYLGDFVLCVIEFNAWLINITSIPNIRYCFKVEHLVHFWVSQEKCFIFLGLITSLLLLLTTCMAFFNVGCPFWQFFIHFLTKKMAIRRKENLKKKTHIFLVLHKFLYLIHERIVH